MRKRKIGAAIGLVGVLIGVATAGEAWARGTTTVTGNNVCSRLSGSITFSPSLHTRGKAEPEFPKITLTLASCSSSRTTGGLFSATEGALNTTACTDIGANGSTGGSVSWKPSSVSTTDIVFERRAEISGPPVAVKLSKGSTGTGGGSFAGSALATLVLKQTQAQIDASCRSSAGLSRLDVVGGSFKVGPAY